MEESIMAESVSVITEEVAVDETAIDCADALATCDNAALKLAQGYERAKPAQGIGRVVERDIKAMTANVIDSQLDVKDVKKLLREAGASKALTGTTLNAHKRLKSLDGSLQAQAERLVILANPA